jgi:hypothetical protein
MGKFILSITDADLRVKFIKKLQNDCDCTFELLHNPMTRLVIPFAAVFYACFIFDIYGDQAGWRNAIVLFTLMTSSPIIIQMCFALCKILIGVIYKETNNNFVGKIRYDNNTVVNIELTNVNNNNTNNNIILNNKVERKGDELQSVVQNIIHNDN